MAKRQSKYPMKVKAVCCNCGKEFIRTLVTCRYLKRPPYCSQRCINDRRSKVMMGVLPSVKSEAFKKGEVKDPKVNQFQKYKKNAEEGRKDISEIQGPTDFEKKLWG